MAFLHAFLRAQPCLSRVILLELSNVHKPVSRWRSCIAECLLQVLSMYCVDTSFLFISFFLFAMPLRNVAATDAGALLLAMSRLLADRLQGVLIYAVCNSCFERCPLTRLCGHVCKYAVCFQSSAACELCQCWSQ